MICKRCVMDTTAAGIHFDENGICNFCTEFLERSGELINETVDQKSEKLNQLVDQIKADGRGKPYDCIVGVSGGVDSSWTLVKVKQLGLRPLAVHMDNGWNSELAQNNIANLVRDLGVDLYTHVIDWDEYRELMQAFFDADVIDVELLYDNAMLAVNYRQAYKYQVKYILSGSNQATEGMRMPSNWNWNKFDKRNIKSIAKRNGGVKLNTFPSIGQWDVLFYVSIKGIQWVSFLDYLDYNKESVLQALESQYGYKRYPYKHYESIFTRFYQAVILPEKFNVDKRKLHLSNLIMTGQLSRSDAMNILEDLPYPDQNQEKVDREYFLKKMNWSTDDYQSYISRPEKSHLNYKNEEQTYKYINLLSIAIFILKNPMSIIRKIKKLMNE